MVDGHDVLTMVIADDLFLRSPEATVELAAEYADKIRGNIAAFDETVDALAAKLYGIYTDREELDNVVLEDLVQAALDECIEWDDLAIEAICCALAYASVYSGAPDARIVLLGDRGEAILDEIEAWKAHWEQDKQIEESVDK